MKLCSLTAKRLASLSAIPLLVTMINVYASPHVYSQSIEGRLDHAYDHGYDDGYDDAMDDCPCPPWHYLLGGWYLGLGGGYEGFQTMRKPSLFDDYIGNLSTHANGWNGRLFGGYGNYYKNYYFGAEGFIGTSSATGRDIITTPGTEYHGRFSADTSWGLSVLPGLRFGNSGPLVFTRLGYVDTKFEVNDSSGSTNMKSTHWTSGFNAGLGVEMPLYNNWSGRIEYDYIKYSSFNTHGNAASNNAPSDNLGLLSLKYTFNNK